MPSRAALRKYLPPLLGLVLFGAAAWFIYHEVRGFPYYEVGDYLSRLPLLNIGWGIVLTALNFVILSGYDVLALRFAHRRLAYRRVLLASFIGYSFSHALGGALVTGGSVRYRLYSEWDVDPYTIATTVVFGGVSFWIGLLSIGSLLLFMEPPALVGALEMKQHAWMVGILIGLPVVAYVVTAAVRSRPVRLMGTVLPMPKLWMIPVQVGLAALELMVTAAVLYILLPTSASIPFFYVVGAFVLALSAGVLSQIPGGLGVFDGLLLLLLQPYLETSTIAGVLLAFRGIFHLLPLVISALMLGLYEALQWSDETSSPISEWSTSTEDA
ncbi:lysylphosphatidylglycerol synthase domain-containing protein [Salisaeta longa]|uniref:lysylphosphatidylglycerol synthase domain-containing protein n=1 Tax=Salisaeta longa TaxID=503170 RepID=UPI0003B6C9A8|nr:lysylphosphatidylglycerol synthase domain-containing protein [Salisaeta longa]